MSTISTKVSAIKASKAGKVVFWLIIAGVVTFAGYKVYTLVTDNGLKNQAEDDAAAAAALAASSPTPANKKAAQDAAALAAAAKAANGGYPLQYGSVGANVKKLQAALGVTADGIFGPITQAALKTRTGKTSVLSSADLDAIINPPAASSGNSKSVYAAQDGTQVLNIDLASVYDTKSIGDFIGYYDDGYQSQLPAGKSVDFIAVYVPGKSYKAVSRNTVSYS